jgi:hypothetical protein
MNAEIEHLAWIAVKAALLYATAIIGLAARQTANSSRALSV